jgi:hypothetical protein
MFTTDATHLIKRDGKTVIKTSLVQTIRRYSNKPGYKVVKVPTNR